MFSSPTASLYCPEMVEGGEALWMDDALQSSSSPSPLVWSDPACPMDELMASETEYCLDPEYIERLRDRALDCAARQDAINWILKVHGFYGFRPATAYLAVNYLDRFLSCNELPLGSGSQWPWQLLSVACLSVAAKMEETQVPLLLDLQVMDPRFVFEPITVQRMEVLLMAALRWRMRSVTPFDILDRLDGAGRRSGSGGGGNGFAGVISRASALVLATLCELDLVSYRPSEIAAAAVVCASDLAYEDEGDGALSCLFDMVGKEAVDGCRMLMGEYLIGTCLSVNLDKQQPMPAVPENPASALPPRSPVGVLEAAAACGRCDTESSALPEPRPDIIPEPIEGPSSPKRRRLVGDFQCTESIDDTVDCGADL